MKKLIGAFSSMMFGDQSLDHRIPSVFKTECSSLEEKRENARQRMAENGRGLMDKGGEWSPHLMVLKPVYPGCKVLGAHQ